MILSEEWTDELVEELRELDRMTPSVAAIAPPFATKKDKATELGLRLSQLGYVRLHNAKAWVHVNDGVSILDEQLEMYGFDAVVKCRNSR